MYDSLRIANKRRLTIAGRISVSAVILLSARPTLPAAPSEPDVPPIVSVEEAQRQVPFTMRVPTYLPPGGKLDGVRVHQVRMRPNREKWERIMRENTHEIFGYGLLTDYDTDRSGFFVRALAGSPGARAGIGQRFELRLLAVNGYRLGSAAKEEARTRAFFKADTAHRRTMAKTEPPLGLRMNAEPLRLTVKDPHGAVRIILIPRREKFIFRPEEPDSFRGDPAGNRAALLYTLRDLHFILHENRTVPGAKQATSPLAERLRIQGTEVILSGPPLTPTAFWKRDGVDFTLDNYQLVVTRKEVLRIIASLIGS